MNSPYASIVLIAVLVLLMYFVVLRPQRKRQQAQQQTLRAMEPGTRVMTTSGIYATVVHVGEKQMVLETSPGVEITVLKQAVAKVVPDGEEDEPAGYDDQDGVDELDGEDHEAVGTWPPTTTTSTTATGTGESVWSSGTDVSSSAAEQAEVPRATTGTSGHTAEESGSALGDSSLTDESRAKRD